MNKDLYFQELSDEHHKLLNQALNVALVSADRQQVIFACYGKNTDATPAEKAHAKEILQRTLDHQVVFYGAHDFIAAALNFVADDIETWVANAEDNVSVQASLEEYSKYHGMIATPLTAKALRKLAYMLCPSDRIKYSKTFEDAVMIPKLEGSKVGVVVNDILYDMDRDSEIGKRIMKEIERGVDRAIRKGKAFC